MVTTDSGSEPDPEVRRVTREVPDRVCVPHGGSWLRRALHARAQLQGVPALRSRVVRHARRRGTTRSLVMSAQWTENPSPQQMATKDQFQPGYGEHLTTSVRRRRG